MVQFSVDKYKYLFLDYLCEEGIAIGKSVAELRKYVRQQGRGKEITATTLNSKIYENDIDGLITDLEELFLEPLNYYYKSYLKEAINKGLNGKHIMNWYNTGQRHIALLIQPSRALRLHNN